VPTVAAIGYQARRFLKRALALQQRITHGRQRGNLGGPGTDLFVTQVIGHIVPFQDDALGMTFRRSDELHIKVRRQQLQGFFVGEVDAVVAGGKCQQAVQRAGIQQAPARRLARMPAIVPLPEPLGPSMVITGALIFTIEPLGQHGCRLGHTV